MLPTSRKIGSIWNFLKYMVLGRLRQVILSHCPWQVCDSIFFFFGLYVIYWQIPSNVSADECKTATVTLRSVLPRAQALIDLEQSFSDWRWCDLLVSWKKQFSWTLMQHCVILCVWARIDVYISGMCMCVYINRYISQKIRKWNLSFNHICVCRFLYL